MTRSRLKTVWTFGIVVALLTGAAIFKDMNDVAVIGVGVLGGIVAKYSHDETKRKSIKNDE